MPHNWLPGDIRDRIRDLCRANNLKQSELAHAIGIDKSTLSRFMSGKTDKLSDTRLQKIAQRLNVSTDFLLGNTDIPDRKHYDIGELGLTVQAARKTFPSTSLAPLQLGRSASLVFPIPLPPEVANGTMVFPVRSWLSRKVLMIVGATYHQIGKPTNTTS